MLSNKLILITLITLMFIDACKYFMKIARKMIKNCKFILAMAIWCYRCNSATPGCSDNFNWRGIGYLGEPCPEDDDICVKVIERKGGKKINFLFLIFSKILRKTS